MGRLILADIIGYINLVVIVLAGLLIVSNKKQYKLLAIAFYMVSNVCYLAIGYLTHVNSLQVSFLVFVVLNIVNMVRVLKQK